MMVDSRATTGIPDCNAEATSGDMWRKCDNGRFSVVGYRLSVCVFSPSPPRQVAPSLRIIQEFNAIAAQRYAALALQLLEQARHGLAGGIEVVGDFLVGGLDGI